MEQKTGATQDYYILFRDATVPTPLTRKERDKQREVLLGDTATYVWGYVGELGKSQAESALKRLVLEFEEKCVGKPESSAITRVITYNAVEQLALIKKRCVIDNKENLEKRQGSFVALVSLETLLDMWRRFGYCQPMNLLRRTMEIWVVKVLEANKIFTSEQKLRSAKIKNEFKSTIFDDETYIPTLTLRQREVLGKCLDIVNGIRAESGCEGKNIKNKYLELFGEKISDSSHPPLTQAANEQTVPSVINKNFTAPLAKSEKLRVVPKPVTKQKDVLDRLEKLEGRWVSQNDFLDKKINANCSLTPLKTLIKCRKTGYVVWSEKKPAIGRDKVGNFLEKESQNGQYEYRYFLLKKYDKQSLFHVANAGIDSTPLPLKENATASEPVTGTPRNVASSPTQPTAKGKPSRPMGKKYPVPKKDTPKAASVNDSKSDSEPVKVETPKQTRRNTAERVENVKKIVETYWKKVINGELVTQKDVALLKFPNEPNILSKKVAKPYMKKISDAVKIAKAKYRSIRNFDDRIRAELLTYVRDTLEG